MNLVLLAFSQVMAIEVASGDRAWLEHLSREAGICFTDRRLGSVTGA